MTLFLTYGAVDRDRALELVTGLRSAGHTIHTDHRLAGGADWWAGILTAIQEADTVLYAASTGPAPSPAAVCEREYASALGTPVLEIRLPPAPQSRAAGSGTTGLSRSPAGLPGSPGVPRDETPERGSRSDLDPAGAVDDGSRQVDVGGPGGPGGGPVDVGGPGGSGGGSVDVGGAGGSGGRPVVDFVAADAAAAFRLVGAIAGLPARSPMAAWAPLPESPFALLGELAQDVQAVAIDQVGFVERLRDAAASEPTAAAARELAAIFRNRLDLNVEAARRLDAAIPRASGAGAGSSSAGVPGAAATWPGHQGAAAAGGQPVGPGRWDPTASGPGDERGPAGAEPTTVSGSVGNSRWARPTVSAGGEDDPAAAGQAAGQGGSADAGQAAGSGGQGGEVDVGLVAGSGGSAAAGVGRTGGSAWARPGVDTLTEDAVRVVAFGKPSVGRRGYDERSVDAFLDLVEEDLRARRVVCSSPEEPGGPVAVNLSPADVRAVRFARPPFGRRGYDEEQVDSFLDRIARAFTALDDELRRRGTVTSKG